MSMLMIKKNLTFYFSQNSLHLWHELLKKFWLRTPKRFIKEYFFEYLFWRKKKEKILFCKSHSHSRGTQKELILKRWLPPVPKWGEASTPVHPLPRITTHTPVGAMPATRTRVFVQRAAHLPLTPAWCMFFPPSINNISLPQLTAKGACKTALWVRKLPLTNVLLQNRAPEDHTSKCHLCEQPCSIF